jgi:BioD-like phosphotransacetylase family protein
MVAGGQAGRVGFPAVKNLFITSTRHNEGKTVVALGLSQGLARKVKNLGFIKPVGKASVEFAGDRIDHDVALVKEACKIPAFVKDMGPVCYDGFPAGWITPEGRDAVVEKIKAGFAKVAAGKNLVVIEGTGNAAAGAAFGLSNAFIAKMLNAKVVLVVSGGVGQPTDEVILNKAYYERSGVEVYGVIVNKALAEERDRIDKWMRRVLDMMNVRLLGVVPYDVELSRGTPLHLMERFKGRALHQEAAMGRPLGRVVIGAEGAGAVLDRLSGQVSLLVPPDRDDVLVSALSAMFLSGRKDLSIASILLAGPGTPSETVLRMLKRTTIPVLAVDQDVFTVASEIHAQNFKILPGDGERVARAVDLVQKHVDLDLTLEGLKD